MAYVCVSARVYWRISLCIYHQPVASSAHENLRGDFISYDNETDEDGDDDDGDFNEKINTEIK